MPIHRATTIEPIAGIEGEEAEMKATSGGFRRCYERRAFQNWLSTFT
jgi:hypothetical protein